MWRQVLALILKELVTLFKDGKSRMVLIGPPIIQLMVFGYGATFDLNRVPIAIYNSDHSQASRDLAARFTGSPSFKEVATLTAEQQIGPMIDSRQAAMVLVLDRRFTSDLFRHRGAKAQMIVDGRNSNTALLITGYANAIVSDFEADWLATHGEPPSPARLVERAWHNPAMLSRWFIVPGIVALLTQVVTLLVVAMSVAREREAGTFDQLLMTPMSPFAIVLGKALPGLLIGVVEASVIVLAAHLWFEIPLRGSLPALYFGLLLFVAAVTGIGLAISSLAATQQQALLGAFLFMVPSIILSGFATPINNMPPAIQDLTLLNPMRYFLVVVRGVFLEGADAGSLTQQYWPLGLIAAISLTVAGWLFRRRSY